MQTDKQASWQTGRQGTGNPNQPWDRGHSGAGVALPYAPSRPFARFAVLVVGVLVWRGLPHNAHLLDAPADDVEDTEAAAIGADFVAGRGNSAQQMVDEAAHRIEVLALDGEVEALVE